MKMVLKQKVWIPSVLALGTLGTLLYFAFPPTPTDKHGRGPEDAVIAYENAVIQEDGATIKQVATDSLAKEISQTLDIPLGQGKQNDFSIPKTYVLKKYEITSKDYWISIRWPSGNLQMGDDYHVVFTEDEWKLERATPKAFRIITEGLEPEIIRGGVNE
jgi:hypothetical protein